MAFPRVDGFRTIEFGTPGESRTRILDFLFNGNKRATAGLLKEDYQDENEQIEHVGEVLVVLGNEREPVGKIQVTRVEVVPFGEVPDEFALAEAEGDLSASDFRDSHGSFWASCGYQVDSTTEIVTVYFELLK